MKQILQVLLVILCCFSISNSAPGDTIDVLVAYTLSAENYVNSPRWNWEWSPGCFPGTQADIIPPLYTDMNSIVDAAVADLNTTVQNTNIRNATTGRIPYFRLVCRMRTTTNVDSIVSMNVLLARFENANDSFFIDVDVARIIHRADLIVLLAHMPNAAHSGLATTPNACLSQIDVAATQRCFTHEIGHVMGAGPNDGNNQSNGMWGIHPDAGILRSVNAIWRTQSCNITPQYIRFYDGTLCGVYTNTHIIDHTATLLYNQNGNDSAAIGSYFKSNEIIQCWSTTDTSVYWRGIRIADGNRSTAFQRPDADIIAGNLVARSNLRTVLAEQIIQNRTFTEDIYGIVEASDSVVLMPGTTILEGAEVNFGISGGFVAKKWTNEGVSAVQKELSPINIRAQPNPFNSMTYIYLDIREQAADVKRSGVKIDIFSIDGKHVRNVFDGQQVNGEYRYFWDGKNKFKNQVTAGTFILRVMVDNKIRTCNLAFVK